MTTNEQGYGHPDTTDVRVISIRPTSVEEMERWARDSDSRTRSGLRGWMATRMRSLRDGLRRGRARVTASLPMLLAIPALAVLMTLTVLGAAAMLVVMGALAVLIAIPVLLLRVAAVAARR